jgi:hypothetical protein
LSLRRGHLSHITQAMIRVRPEIKQKTTCYV